MFSFEAGGTLRGVAGTASAITVTVSGVSVSTAGVEAPIGLLYQGQIPNAAGVLFTVPAGQSWIVKTINITNATGSSVAGVQLFQNGSAAANSLIGPITMAGHYTLTGSENGWAMTDAAGVLQISSSGGGGGTVTSVGLSLPAQFGVTGSPVTGSGTLTAAWTNETANTVFAGPNTGSPATPAFRALVAADIPSVPGSLLNIQYLTSTGSGTYTPTTGTNSVVLLLVGGGGGSSGVASAAGSQVNLGGSGGGGAFLQKRLTANFSGAGYVVGAGGSAGTSGNNNGGNGVSTTFTSTGGSPVTYTAGGGVGGVVRTSFAPPISNGGNLGGTATNGDINIAGGSGLFGLSVSTFISNTPPGGDSQMGKGAAATTCGNASSTAGLAGLNYGGGAAGAISSNAGGAQAGAVGGNGIIIIYEYS